MLIDFKYVLYSDVFPCSLPKSGKDLRKCPYFPFLSRFNPIQMSFSIAERRIRSFTHVLCKLIRGQLVFLQNRIYVKFYFYGAFHSIYIAQIDYYTQGLTSLLESYIVKLLKAETSSQIQSALREEYLYG